MTKEQFIDGARHALMHEITGGKTSCARPQVTCVEDNGVLTVTCEGTESKIVGSLGEKADGWNWEIVREAKVNE
jgi:hypothetical protein